jgi:hypothetical protein
MHRQTLAELANQIDADTQGKIISAVHSRIPIVTPNEQRALRVRPRPQRSEKAPHHEGTKDDVGTLPFPRIPSLPTAENEGMHNERHAEVAKERITQAERGKSVESGFDCAPRGRCSARAAASTTPEELAKKLGMRSKRSARPWLSLETPIGDEGDSHLGRHLIGLGNFSDRLDPTARMPWR